MAGPLLPLLLVSQGFNMAGAYYGAKEAESAARIQKRAAKLDAKMIELGATQREADRKELLAENMATSIAMQAANGGGISENVLKSMAEKEGRATERDKFMSDLEAMTVRARAKMTPTDFKDQALTQVVQGGLNTATTYYGSK